MILALDLGQSMGYAIGDQNGMVVSGTLDLRGNRCYGAGMQFLDFDNQLEAWRMKYRLKELVHEDVRRHGENQVFAAHIYGGFLATLQTFCERNRVPYKGYPVGAIKKHATGTGAASKSMMVKAAEKKYGAKNPGEDEADAIHILHLHLYEQRHRLKKTPPDLAKMLGA